MPMFLLSCVLILFNAPRRIIIILFLLDIESLELKDGM